MFSGIFEHLGSLGAFALIALEYLGIPLPSELSYFYFRSQVFINHMSWPVVIAIIMSAHLIGSLTAYEIGRRLGGSHTRKLTTLQEKIHGWYEKRGGLLVFGAQLIGHVRPWTSYVAGYAGMPRRDFIIYSMSGAAVLSGVILALAEVIGSLWHHYPILRLFITGIGSIAVLFAIVGVVRQWHDREKDETETSVEPVEKE